MADGGALTFGGEQTIKYSHRPYGTDPYPSAFQALRARLPSFQSLRDKSGFKPLLPYKACRLGPRGESFSMRRL